MIRIIPAAPELVGDVARQLLERVDDPAQVGVRTDGRWASFAIPEGVDVEGVEGVGHVADESGPWAWPDLDAPRRRGDAQDRHQAGPAQDQAAPENAAQSRQKKRGGR
ncbi:hypothetical protein [Bailinhaonella thermotolerans]|uniref:Uncharacterized protein n=1 Tax=Bailinhaonella thermotolerans TaxID=1070861 RepID=A0A3A3ZX72_9ACTN|nr:hypothetical protein [Bailinhaonella thermotolerans]RJL19340.1 hypothetical protein D5H75_40465 [Bailinhaonella thermotolerans]